MKTSEIKQIIKEEIKSILTESYGDVGNGDKFWDWPVELVNGHRPTGYVLLHFGRADVDWFRNALYILNPRHDTWFRRTEGIGKGYGLLLRGLKVGNVPIKKTEIYNIYRCRITYWPVDNNDYHEDDRSANWDTEDGLIWIVNTVDKNDVLHYINQNMSKWKP